MIISFDAKGKPILEDYNIILYNELKNCLYKQVRYDLVVAMFQKLYKNYETMRQFQPDSVCELVCTAIIKEWEESKIKLFIREQNIKGFIIKELNDTEINQIALLARQHYQQTKSNPKFRELMTLTKYDLVEKYLFETQTIEQLENWVNEVRLSKV